MVAKNQKQTTDPFIVPFEMIKLVEDWEVTGRGFHVKGEDGPFKMGLTYPNAPVLLPTDPEVNCTWGDGTETPNQVFNTTAADPDISENRTFWIEQEYAASGEFNITCVLHNVISHQVLEHYVSRDKSAKVLFTVTSQHFIHTYFTLTSSINSFPGDHLRPHNRLPPHGEVR